MTSVLLLFVFVLGGTKSELGRCPNRFPLFFRGRPGESISVDPLSPRGPPNLGGSLSLCWSASALGKPRFTAPKSIKKLTSPNDHRGAPSAGLTGRSGQEWTWQDLLDDACEATERLNGTAGPPSRLVAPAPERRSRWGGGTPPKQIMRSFLQ